MINTKSKLLRSTALCASIFSFGLVSTANASLESRLGGDAYYDTDLNVTWAADANMSSGLNWADQMAWASSLTIDAISGWRLPEITEMSHLYNVEGISFSSPGPFSNVQLSNYWSSTEFDSSSAWNFIFNGGFQEADDKNFTLLGWAVHSGDVAAIPEPSTYAMLLAGLGLLGFSARHKKTKRLI